MRVVMRMAERSQVKKIVLIGILAIALAAVLLVEFGGLPIGSGKSVVSGAPSPNAPADGSSIKPAQSTPATPVKVQIAWKRPDPIGPLAGDPMRMDIQEAARTEGPANREPNDLQHLPEQPKFLVTGIIFSTEQPSSVIIDGHILHEGDTIYGATVAKITEQYAELSRADKKWSIKPGQANPEP
jgi:hypothetical protein